MKLEFVKTGGDKITDNIANLTEEEFNAIVEKKAKVYSEITRKMLLEPGYIDSDAMRDVQEAFPPGTKEATVIMLLGARREINAVADKTTEKIFKVIDKLNESDE